MSGWSTNRSNSGSNNPNNGINNSGSSESGILRKAKVIAPHIVEPHHLDDLLVFGYACKIFRDDARATQIDHGKHLIPWMGDASLKIDRYDVRATMSDITAYEAPTVSSSYADQLATLTPAEQRAEQLCEQERYHSLYNNDVEEEMYKDETLKRLHRERSATYGQVPFDYAARSAMPNTDDRQTIASGSVESCASMTADQTDLDEEPFVVNSRFYVPPTIETPDTMKLHAVIEKTARFIAAQGPQMEILIKAKQSNNPQFEFLNLNNRLNAYYRHVLNAIKNGYYPIEESMDPANDSTTTTSVATEGSATTPNDVITNPPPMVVVPQIKYKPSADCAYTQLISKIKGVVPMTQTSADTDTDRNVKEIEGARDSPDSFSREATLRHIKGFEQFQKNQATDAAKLAKANSVTNASTKTTDKSQQSTTTAKQTTNGSSNHHSKVVAKVEVKKISNALMLAQCYNSDSDENNDDDITSGVDNNTPTAEHVSTPEPPTTTDTADNMPAGIPIPPAELQNIIDKTAAYVLKNGKEFEEILRTKNDQRFAFLTYTDPYNRYYVYRVTNATMCSSSSSITTATISTLPPPLQTSSSTASVATTMLKDPPKSVSFSIKPKEETATLLSQRAVLPRELSSDDEDNTEMEHPKIPSAVTETPVTATVASPPTAAIGPGLLPTPIKPKVLLPTPHLPSAAVSPHIVKQASITVPIAVSAPLLETVSAIIDAGTNAQRPIAMDSRNDDACKTVHSSCENGSLSEVNLRDALLDASDFTAISTMSTITATAVTDHRNADARRCADALKDRLAQAARDKLGAVSREKQLQMERRKKAMAFLNQMKTDSPVSSCVKASAAASTDLTDATLAASLSSPAKPTNGDVVVIVDDAVVVESVQRNGDDDHNGQGTTHQQSDTASVHSVHSSPAHSVVVVLNGGVVSDDDNNSRSSHSTADTDTTSSASARRQARRKRSKRHSRSRSPSTSSRRHKRKKSKHHRSERHHAAKKSRSSKSSTDPVQSGCANTTSSSQRSRRSRSRSHSCSSKSSRREHRTRRSRSADSSNRHRRDGSTSSRRSRTSHRHKSSHRREAS